MPSTNEIFGNPWSSSVQVGAAAGYDSMPGSMDLDEHPNVPAQSLQAMMCDFDVDMTSGGSDAEIEQRGLYNNDDNNDTCPVCILSNIMITHS